jgi:sensor c-di-GMP phosphodiesterase-like protein
MYLANRQSVHIEAGKAQVLADDVMRRSEESGQQGRAAAEALAANRAELAFAPEEIALMRQLAISSSYLQGVGRVQANRLICSSLGNHGAGFDLGPPDYITDRGVTIWVAATLPVGPQSFDAFMAPSVVEEPAKRAWRLKQLPFFRIFPLCG